MERADKIFMAVACAVLIAILIREHGTTRRNSKSPAKDRVNISATPANTPDKGPAYMLSALPIARVNDNYAGDASYSTGAECSR